MSYSATWTCQLDEYEYLSMFCSAGEGRRMHYNVIETRTLKNERAKCPLLQLNSCNVCSISYDETIGWSYKLAAAIAEEPVAQYRVLYEIFH